MRVPQEIISWLFTFMMFFILLIFGLWTYNNNASADFNQDVHTIIQDHGGLTTNAQDLIQQISNNEYHDHFKVVTDDGKDSEGAANYGQPITYQIEASIPLTKTYMTHFDQHWQTVSLVRPDTQN